MSTTDALELPDSARRFHELYHSDLSRVEPISDAQILGRSTAPKRTTATKSPDAGRWDVAAHLGFVHNSWTRGDCGHSSTRSSPPGASATFAALVSTWLR